MRVQPMCRAAVIQPAHQVVPGRQRVHVRERLRHVLPMAQAPHVPLLRRDVRGLPAPPRVRELFHIGRVTVLTSRDINALTLQIAQGMIADLEE